MKRAQYRFLGRVVRGERLSVFRFRPIGTVAALREKCLITIHVGTRSWIATDLGRKRHAQQKPLPPDQVAALYPERVRPPIEV